MQPHSLTLAGTLAPGILLLLFPMKTSLYSLRPVSLACAAVCASLFTPVAFAQTATTPQLKETVVSASRIEQALQTAPIGASVILGEDIRASGMLDANEAVRKLGGVAARSDLNGGREASIDLRGFGDTAANNLVVLVDGVRISENEQASARLSSISPDMIERIEIIRGGASVVWGEGATAGVVNVITKIASQRGVSGAVQLGVASFGGRDARASVNVAGETARFHAQVRSYDTRGVRSNNAHTNENLNLGVEMGDDKGLKARLSFFSDNVRSRWPGAVNYPTYLANPTTSITPKDFGKQAEDRLSAAVQYRLNDWLLALDVSNRDKQSRGLNDYGLGGDSDAKTHTKGTQISPRATYQSAWGANAVTVVLGLDQAHWDYQRQTTYSGFLGSDELASQRSRAHFVKADVVLPSQTRIVTGLRNERIEQTYLENVSSSSLNQKHNLQAWELGLNQTLASGLDAYGRSAKSYRIANVDDSRFLFTPLRPQTSKDVELGLRWSQQGSSAALRVFRQNTVNEIAYDNPTFSNINLDPVLRTGVELEGRTQLARDWSLSGSVQQINPRFSSGINVGKTPPHVSKFNATVRTGYALSAAHQVELALQKRSSAVLGNDWANACALRAPSRTTLDALYRFRAGNAERGWTMTAGVDNLTNAKSFSWAYTNAACNPVNVYPETGRLFKLSARYAFS